MGLLQRIFGDTRDRQARRVWKNDCVWGTQKLSDTRVDWIGVGGVFEAGSNTFEHMSAHRALGRTAVIDRWENIVDEKRCTPGPQLVKRWAGMDSAPLWHALQVGVAQNRVLFNSNLFWTIALEEAGGVGNVASFDVAPARALRDYATWKEHKPHPAVGLWLHAKGLVSMEYLREQVARDYCMADNSFGLCKEMEPMAPEYVVDWCVCLLRDYGLSDEQKVGVVGQAIRGFGAKVWDKHLASACAPFVGDMDIALLKALCGKGNGTSPLEKTAGRFAQNDSKVFNPDLSQPLQEGEDTMLRMLVQLAPPQNRLDLYFLACRAKQSQKLIQLPQEILELPALA